MRRTQIYLDDDQAARLDRRAAAEGATRSRVIRTAIDHYLAAGEHDAAAWRARWKDALGRTAGIAPYLSDGASYVEELRTADAARLRGVGG